MLSVNLDSLPISIFGDGFCLGACLFQCDYKCYIVVGCKKITVSNPSAISSSKIGEIINKELKEFVYDLIGENEEVYTVPYIKIN